MKLPKLLIALLAISVAFSCNPKPEAGVPVIGFVDAFEDATIAQAKYRLCGCA
jgi:putative ABC transport system substrate-binding protein